MKLKQLSYLIRLALNTKITASGISNLNKRIEEYDKKCEPKPIDLNKVYKDLKP